MLEILAGIPTVVYGFFAALTVGPLFRAGFNWLGAEFITVGGPLAATGEFLALKPAPAEYGVGEHVAHYGPGAEKAREDV